MSPEQRFFKFVVMDNIFWRPESLTIHAIFDLKGSETNREVPEHEIRKGGTLKDQNLLKICKDINLLVF